jgi:hypothetical protein
MPSTYDSIDDGLKRSRVIRAELQRISEEARQRYAIFAYQDTIGFTIWVSCLIGIAGCVLAYANQVMPAWSVIFSVALLTSILHELEHDLIHRLYFRDRPFLYNTVMLTLWLVRPNGVNPWVRREWHLHHHRVSGTAGDIEERGLLNGERWGIRRFLMSMDGLLAVVLRPFTIHGMLSSYANDQKPDVAAQRRAHLVSFFAYFPFGPMVAAIWWTFLYVHTRQWLSQLLGGAWTPSPTVFALMPTIDFLSVALFAPNILRTICLYFVSSNIHYHGDIEPKNVVQQTQVWTAPWLFPVQLFCFNFGGTHAIHHFAVQHPFYLRQWVAKDAHRVMRENGVRFNDFGSMLRANRWYRSQPANVAEPAQVVSAA